VNIGSKRKAGQKSKPNEVPRTKQARKKTCVDREDVECMHENAGDTEDQADAYDRLRLELETDRPICG